MKNMRCGGVWLKAPSAWLTYIGSLLLTSHPDSLSPTQACTYTHSLSITQEALFIDASLWLPFSPFSAPSSLPFSPPFSICVVRYELDLSESCGAMPD